MRALKGVPNTFKGPISIWGIIEADAYLHVSRCFERDKLFGVRAPFLGFPFGVGKNVFYLSGQHMYSNFF